MQDCLKVLYRNPELGPKLMVVATSSLLSIFVQVAHAFNCD